MTLIKTSERHCAICVTVYFANNSIFGKNYQQKHHSAERPLLDIDPIEFDNKIKIQYYTTHSPNF